MSKSKRQKATGGDIRRLDPSWSVHLRWVLGCIAVLWILFLAVYFWFNGFSFALNTFYTQNAIQVATVVVLVGVGGAITSLAIWRQRTLEDNLALDAYIHLVDRYGWASDRLADSSPTIRMTGVYALQRLSEDCPDKDLLMITEALAGFVRQTSWERYQPTTGPKPIADPATREVPQGELLPLSADILAALEVLRRIKDRAPDQEIDLRGAFFECADLRHLELHGFNLARARFAKSDLDYISLQHCDLTNSDFSEAQLRFAKMRGAKLTGATLLKADLTNATLPDANLDGANLRGANLLNANLQHAQLVNARLQYVNLMGVSLQDASLVGAVLQRANLESANLDDANLRRTDFDGAELAQAGLDGARWDATTRWPLGFVPPRARSKRK